MRLLEHLARLGQYLWVLGAVAIVIVAAYGAREVSTVRDFSRVANEVGRLRLSAQQIEHAAETPTPDAGERALRLLNESLRSIDGLRPQLAGFPRVDAEPRLRRIDADFRGIGVVVQEYRAGRVAEQALAERAVATISEIDELLGAISAEGDRRLNRLRTILLYGLATTVVGSAVTAAGVVSANRRAERALAARLEIGERLNAELRAVTLETTTILESTPDAILLIDEYGTVLRANHALERVFGWTAQEVVGQNVSMLMPEPLRSSHAGYLSHYAATGQASTPEGLVIGRTRESTTGQHQDGHTCPVDITVREVEADTSPRRFVGTLRDASERKAAEALREAERIAEARADFMRVLGHELRSPLNVTLGFGQLLEAGQAGPLGDLQRQHVAEIMVASRHMLSLVNELLDLSRIDAGRWELTPMTFSASACLAALVAGFEPIAARKGVALRAVLPPGPMTVTVDERSCRQVLTNLVANAVNYTERGAVDVEAMIDGAFLSVSVRDTGVGIPEDEIEHVFDEFVQLETRPAGAPLGSGLGLAIVRRLVSLLGGTITVASTPGEGSTFTVRIPVGQVREASAVPA